MATDIPKQEIDRRKALLRSRWPAERMLLLGDTGLAGAARARESWAAYLAQSDLDTTPWVEIRALAAASERIVELAPDSPNIGRIRGFRRFVFFNGQRTFALVRPMLAALAEAGIEMMLLKGAARIAADSSAAAARYLSDVDTLIRLDQRERAWQVARAHNWHFKRNLVPMSGGTWEGQSAASHALEFSPSPEVAQTVLDLHHFSRSLCRNTGDDDSMWARASRAKFLGLDVYFPSPADQLRHTLTHALMHATGGLRPIDWMFDAAEMLNAGGIDWPHFTSETLASNTQAFVGSALLLLKERLGLGIPDRVIASLVAAVAPPYESEFVFRTSAYYKDTNFPDLLADAVAAATHRADSAAHRLSGGRATPLHLSRWTDRRGDGPAEIAPKGVTAFPVPEGLRLGETVQLTISFTSDKQTGQLALLTPLLPLKVWEAGPVDEGQRMERSVTIPANLLLMTRSRFVGVKWTGKLPLGQVKIRWLRGPRALGAATRLARAQAAARLA